MCWPCACCRALTYACRSLSLCARPQRMCLPAVQDAAGAAEKSKIQEWPLYEVSRSGLSVTLERACDGATFCKGILRFQAVKSSNFFWPAGAAPQGRRGRGASRPARPSVCKICRCASGASPGTFTVTSAVLHVMAKPIEKSPGCEPRPGTAWSTFPCA